MGTAGTRLLVAPSGGTSYGRGMRKHDVEVVDAILQARGSFGHREHLELAWNYLTLYPLEAASQVMADAIRHIAGLHGAEDRYHETITRAWLHFVAVHMQRWGADTFDSFIERNPDLLDRRLIEHFYSRQLIFSGPARAAWTAPDVLPLPALV